MVRQIRLPQCASPATQPSMHQAIGDGVMTAKVRASLTTNPATRHYEIHVATIHATVTLSGYVESDEVRSAALQIASEVEGVQQVQDFLDVHRIG